MKRPIIVIASVLGCLAVLLLAAALTGWAPVMGNDDADRPPCSQLPSQQAVVAALDSHQDLVARIEALGSGVSVAVSTPCDDSSLGLVSIRYSTDDERARVHDVLLDSAGFGVPAELVKRG